MYQVIHICRPILELTPVGHPGLSLNLTQSLSFGRQGAQKRPRAKCYLPTETLRGCPSGSHSRGLC
jgi:hypothetical protein